MTLYYLRSAGRRFELVGPDYAALRDGLGAEVAYVPTPGALGERVTGYEAWASVAFLPASGVLVEVRDRDGRVLMPWAR